MDENAKTENAESGNTEDGDSPKCENGTTTEESGAVKKPPPEEDVWSQVQQKCLEAAIKQFGKSTNDRWTCIARAVPEKNKEQCIARFKVLAEMMKQKKTREGEN